MPDDATAKVLIAGSFTKANAARLLDAQPSEGEPYIAFFVGASAAARLCLTAREQNRVFPPCSTRTAPGATLPKRRTVLTARLYHPSATSSARPRTSALCLVEQRIAESESGLVVPAPYWPAGHSALRHLE